MSSRPRTDDPAMPSLTLDQRGAAAWIRLQRPDVHNAFDDVMIAELTAAVLTAEADPAVRVVVLAGAGPSFSAGADVAWMRRQGEADPAANLADARALARLMRAVAECTKPTVARVHGAAIGGGMGLACACDIGVASPRARFAMPEVRLGIIPAVIAPYVVRAIGPRQARRYMLSGETIDAARARELGLAHEVVDEAALDARIDALVAELAAGGPAAQAEVKSLLDAVAGRAVDDALVDDTARCIARVRATPEAAEGLQAFLAHRPPTWRGG